VVTTSSPQASPDRPRTTPPTSTRYSALIDPTIVMCFNCGKESHFTLSCLELKNINNIKEIKEKEMSNELGKEKP